MVADVDELVTRVDEALTRLRRQKENIVSILLEMESDLHGVRVPLIPAQGHTVQELAMARAAVWYWRYRQLRSIDLLEYAEVAALQCKALDQLAQG